MNRFTSLFLSLIFILFVYHFSVTGVASFVNLELEFFNFSEWERVSRLFYSLPILLVVLFYIFEMLKGE